MPSFICLTNSCSFKVVIHIPKTIKDHFISKASDILTETFTEEHIRLKKKKAPAKVGSLFFDIMHFKLIAVVCAPFYQ